MVAASAFSESMGRRMPTKPLRGAAPNIIISAMAAASRDLKIFFLFIVSPPIHLLIYSVKYLLFHNIPFIIFCQEISLQWVIYRTVLPQNGVIAAK